MSGVFPYDAVMERLSATMRAATRGLFTQGEERAALMDVRDEMYDLYAILSAAWNAYAAAKDTHVVRCDP